MKFALFIFVVLLSSCQQRSELSNACVQVVSKYDKCIHRSYKKVRLASYGGSLMHDIEKMSLTYEIITSHDVPNVRRVIIDCIDTFTTIINADARAQPHLHERPFPPERFDLILLLRNQDGYQYEGEGVARVSFYRGVLSYYQHHPLVPGIEPTLLCEETYAEAKSIIEKEKQ